MKARTRVLPDGRTLIIHPLTFGRARVSVAVGWMIEDGY
jgi:hypothetical protein